MSPLTGENSLETHARSGSSKCPTMNESEAMEPLLQQNDSPREGSTMLRTASRVELEVESDDRIEEVAPSVMAKTDVGRRRLTILVLALPLVVLMTQFTARSGGLVPYLRSVGDDSATRTVIIAREAMLYDDTCGPLHSPYNVSSITGSGQMSSQSGTLSSVRQALTSGNLDNRNVILIGDSVMYQIFISLVCLARSAGGLVEYGRKAKVIGNASIMFSEWGGKILTFNERKQATVERNRDTFLSRLGESARPGHNWIKSCEDREVMKFEGVPLSSKDIVFTHATVHGDGRQSNMQKIVRLLTCMDHARNNGEDPGWPTIRIVASLPQHFPGPGGAYSDSSVADTDGCLISINPVESEFYQEETLHFVDNGIPLVGRDLGLEDLGMYHIGSTNPEVKLDCTHWSLPGVPDLIAKEIMEISADLYPSD